MIIVFFATFHSFQYPASNTIIPVFTTVAVVIILIFTSSHFLSICFLCCHILAYPVFYAVVLYALPSTRSLAILVFYISASSYPHFLYFSTSDYLILTYSSYHVKLCFNSLGFLYLGDCNYITETYSRLLIVLCIVCVFKQLLSWISTKKMPSELKPPLLPWITSFIYQMKLLHQLPTKQPSTR